MRSYHFRAISLVKTQRSWKTKYWKWKVMGGSVTRFIQLREWLALSETAEDGSSDSGAQALSSSPLHYWRMGSAWSGQELLWLAHLFSAGSGPNSWLFHHFLHPAVLWNWCLFWPGNPQAARAQRHQGLPRAPALCILSSRPPAADPFPSMLIKFLCAQPSNHVGSLYAPPFPHGLLGAVLWDSGFLKPHISTMNSCCVATEWGRCRNLLSSPAEAPWFPLTGLQFPHSWQSTSWAIFWKWSFKTVILGSSLVA